MASRAARSSSSTLTGLPPVTLFHKRQHSSLGRVPPAGARTPPQRPGEAVPFGARRGPIRGGPRVLQPMPGPARLRELLAAGRLLVAPGGYDGLSARTAEQACFAVLYVSGGAVARSMGLPDVGLVSLTETAQRGEEVRAVTSGPLVVDADTG